MLAIIIYFIAAQIVGFEVNRVVCFDIEESQDKMEFVILDTIPTRAQFIGSK